jgi:glutathione S-transferase
MTEITPEANLEILMDRYPAKTGNADAGGAARFHLFHAATSVCSQKVRTVLFAAGTPFYSHEISLVAGQNYEPSYVRARAWACVANGFSFATDHKGSTSVAETGCDACVVPTIIDGASGEVLIDSLHICLSLDETLGAGLRPSALATAIDREIAIVDKLPNYPLFASKMFGLRPEGGNAFSIGKVTRCNALIASHADEPLLAAAYAAKRDKEQAASDRLFTPAAIAQSESDMRSALESLAARLTRDGDFLFGERITIADIFWAIELIRNRDLGYGAWADALPRLHAYEAKLCAAPCIQHAILDWPGARTKLPPAS